MAKKYFIAIAALVFAGGVLLIERSVFIARLTDLAEERLNGLKNTFTRLDEIVAERNRNGEYFAYLGARAAIGTDAEELNPLPEFIESVLVIDNRDAVRVRSGRMLLPAEKVSLKTADLRTLVGESAILRRYALSDFQGKKTGSLVFIIRPEFSQAGSMLVAASPDFQQITAFSRDGFADTEQKYFPVILPTLMGDKNTFSFRGRAYVSARQIWVGENIVFFHVAPLPHFWQFFGLYFLLAAMVAALVYLINAHAVMHRSRRETSERILADYNKALNENKIALGHLSSLGANSMPIEKLVEITPHDTDVEDRLAALRAEAESARVNKQKPIVIDIEPSDRQFRFMNPSLPITPQVKIDTLLSEDDKRLRTRAFSNELKGLMEALAATTGEMPLPPADSGSLNDPLLREIEAFEATYAYPKIDQYLFYLNELYFDEVTERELTQAIHVAGETVQSREFAVLLYDSHHAVYRTGILGGIENDITTTLYLLPIDSVIPTDFGSYGYLEIKAALKQNPYFKKRFRSTFTETLKGMHIFNLAETYLRAKVIFFDRHRGGGLTDTESVQAIHSYLRQIAPGLHMFFQGAAVNTSSPRDLAEWAVKELKECVSLAGNRQLLISQFVFESALPLDSLLTLTRSATHKLADGEKILLLSPSHLVIAHSAENREAIESIVSAESAGRKFIVKEGEFGKTTRNLYTFIEF